jgi:hypothetical protein
MRWPVVIKHADRSLGSAITAAPKKDLDNNFTPWLIIIGDVGGW